MNKLSALHLRLQYGERVIIKDLTLAFDKPEVISIIGPNGSGKSTLLKALAKLLIPTAGAVYLNGGDMRHMSLTSLAKVLSVLPQSVQAPGDMTVTDLVCFGRMPYRGRFSSLTKADWRSIEAALAATEMCTLRDQPLTALSGGERQRAWLAMALAKEPKILLLDEPTTYLDIRHQLDIMELVVRLHRELGITVIMVMHDLNHAARYSQRLIALKQGEIVADGTVETVFREEVLASLYGIRAMVTTVGRGTEKQRICLPYATI